MGSRELDVEEKPWQCQVVGVQVRTCRVRGGLRAPEFPWGWEGGEEGDHHGDCS